MTEALLQFVALCRRNGVRVSPAEVLDLLAAVREVGLEDPAAFRAALECTLLKRPSDAEVFAELFELYFFRRGDFFSRAGDDAPLLEALRRDGLSEEAIEHLLAILADEAARLDPLARAALGLRRPRIEALLRIAGVRVDQERLTNPMQIGFFTQQALEGLNFRGAYDELSRVRQRLERAIGEAEAARVARLWDENMGKLRSAVRGHVTEEFDRRNVAYLEQFRRDLITHKPFGALTEEELARLRIEVMRLARKIRDQVSLRRRVERRGRLDARRTIRGALVSGGVPFRLVHRRRRQERPRLVVLCDISDSVRHVSRFMLQFAFTLQELFSRVRSFVFVSDLAESTELFKQHELGRAVDLAYGGALVSVYANSNFGRAFRQFQARYLEAVTSRTTVIVIGDARNNYNPPEAWAMGAIRARARRVLWLNPEPPASWGFGDSAMRDYEPHCDRVEVVGNLASLARVMDSLVL